jgi:hypothetical protein
LEKLRLRESVQAEGELDLSVIDNCQRNMGTPSDSHKEPNKKARNQEENNNKKK